MINKLRSFWNKLNQREQYLISGGVLIIAAFFLYFIVWQPLTNRVQDTKHKIIDKQVVYQWLQHSVPLIKTYQQAGFTPISNNMPILSSTEQSLAAAKISQYVTNTQSQGNKQIIISLNNVPFDSFIRWLEVSWQQYNLNIKTADIKKTDTTGAVNATISLIS